jgi:hypothetical protein
VGAAVGGGGITAGGHVGPKSTPFFSVLERKKFAATEENFRKFTVE